MLREYNYEYFMTRNQANHDRRLPTISFREMVCWNASLSTSTRTDGPSELGAKGNSARSFIPATLSGTKHHSQLTGRTHLQAGTFPRHRLHIRVLVGTIPTTTGKGIETGIGIKTGIGIETGIETETTPAAALADRAPRPAVRGRGRP